MIQVRCPDCGYLQSLSEERFLTISEDFLNCPHCNARVPKEWVPTESETAPEEARHKILAFSRRILNGGGVSRDVVHALESLVRRHGPVESGNKALGIGYAAIGETRKAEDFLIAACQESPSDLEILRRLLEVLITGEKFPEAVDVGRSLLEATREKAASEDVARMAIALIGQGDEDEAKWLLESYPDLDPRNHEVRRARKALSKDKGLGVGLLLTETGALGRLLNTRGVERIMSLTRRAKDLVRPCGEKSLALEQSEMSSPEGNTLHEGTTRLGTVPTGPVSMEFWVYSSVSAIPNWQDVRESLAALYRNRSRRERGFRFLEMLIKIKGLDIEYVVRGDAEDLFYYPEELMPQNSRGLTDEDKKIVQEAEMIVRMRLSCAADAAEDPLLFMLKFVEAVRLLTDGVVQDAVSHKLWGKEQWLNYLRNPEEKLVDEQVNFEALEDETGVWIHSHGLQKFGIPELEMEGVSTESAPQARRFMSKAAVVLVEARRKGKELKFPVEVPNTPFLFNVEGRESDEEGHFPIGSLLLEPVRGDSRAPSLGLAGEVEQEVGLSEESVPQKAEFTGAVRLDDRRTILRARLIAAHRKARSNMAAFENSFRTCNPETSRVHAVKVGFPSERGQYEWMWVSLDTWHGRQLGGHLQNSPVLRRDLRKGSRIEFTDTDIFDWVIVTPDSILDGAYTERINA